MKPLVRNILLLGIVAASIAVVVILDKSNTQRRSLLTCQGIKVEVADSATGTFVNVKEIKNLILEEVGPWTGVRLDSVKLLNIEEVLSGKAAVYGCQAYMGGEGKLNVIVHQRRPVVRFQGEKSSFYADASGYIFPIKKKYSAWVPIVDGAIPIGESMEYSGQVKDPKTRKWVMNIIDMLDFIGKSPVWKNTIGQITANADGSLTLIPSKGQEVFIFGQPVDFEEKFSKIVQYYENIAPAKKDKPYKTVNVRYKGQIICK